jgi:hypothetical protein
VTRGACSSFLLRSGWVKSRHERRPYGFGKRRFAPLDLLTLIAHSGRRSCGVVITKFSGHIVTLRSSPTVFADKLTSRSTSTCILAGKPPRATWSAAMLLGLYRIWAPCCRLPDCCAAILFKTVGSSVPSPDFIARSDRRARGFPPSEQYESPSQAGSNRELRR